MEGEEETVGVDSSELLFDSRSGVDDDCLPGEGENCPSGKLNWLSGLPAGTGAV